MTSKEVVELHMKAWFKFHLQYINEKGEDYLNANAIWKWPDYLKQEMNKLVKFEEVVYAVNSSSISL